MTHRIVVAGAGLGLALLGAGPVLAQPEADALRERTGPASAAPPLPAYAETRPDLTEDQAAPATTKTPAGAVTFSDVRVTGTLSAAPRRGWAPVAGGQSSVRISHAPGERLDAAWVRRQVLDNGLIGRPAPLDRVVALVQEINLALVRNGYVNSGVLIVSAPVDGAVLELALVTGHLTAEAPGGPAVTVAWPKGRNGLRDSFVRDRMPAASAIPLNAIAVERDFRRLAENPAIRTINADLRPGDRPGEASLALTVIPQRRFDVYGVVANNRSPSIGGERAAVGGSMRNILSSGDLLSAETGVTAGRPDYTAGYETPIFSPRNTLTLRGGFNGAAVVDAPLRPLNIEAEDWSAEAGLARRLIERPLTPAAEPGRWTPAQTLTVGVRLAHRRSETSLLGRPFSFSPGAVDGRAEYSVLRVTGDWIQRGVDQVLALSLTGSQGLEGTRGDIPGLATPDQRFRVILAQASYARRLDRHGLELRARIGGQWADGLLYSGERFSAGGEFSVRGYRETIALADTGANASVEIARPFSLSGGRRDARGWDWGAVSLAVFADGAVLHNRQPPQPQPERLASVGASLSWVPSDVLLAKVTYAVPLFDAPLVGSRDLQDRGLQFRVVIRPLSLFRF